MLEDILFVLQYTKMQFFRLQTTRRLQWNIFEIITRITVRKLLIRNDFGRIDNYIILDVVIEKIFLNLFL